MKEFNKINNEQFKNQVNTKSKTNKNHIRIFKSHHLFKLNN